MKAFNKKRNSKPKEVIINKSIKNEVINFKKPVIPIIKGRNININNCVFNNIKRAKQFIIIRKSKNVLIENCCFNYKKPFKYKKLKD